MARLVAGRQTIERRKRGIAAEKHVHEILKELPKTRFVIFHDIKVRYGNIDDLVVSREGAVFLIETKSHRGKVAFDGKELLVNGKPFQKNFIGQINRNIRWLRDLIKERCVNVWIVAVLVFTNALIYSQKGKRVLRLRPVKRVNVINEKFLKKLVESYSPKNPQRVIWQNLDMFEQDI